MSRAYAFAWAAVLAAAWNPWTLMLFAPAIVWVGWQTGQRIATKHVSRPGRDCREPAA